jgi:hypothetical protein
MRISYSVILEISTAGVLLLVAVMLPSYPWVYSVQIDVDRNSGDLLYCTCILGRRVGERIEASPFSNEVRRVGISVPESRRWEHVGTKLLVGGSRPYRYFGLMGDCTLLLRYLDELKMPDQERADILARALVSFQRADSIGIQRLLIEVGQRLIPEELRGLPGAPFSHREEEARPDRANETARGEAR